MEAQARAELPAVRAAADNASKLDQKELMREVKAIVGNLSADEKAELFVNGASSVNRINWPKYNW